MDTVRLNNDNNPMNLKIENFITLAFAGLNGTLVFISNMLFGLVISMEHINVIAGLLSIVTLLIRNFRYLMRGAFEIWLFLRAERENKIGMLKEILYKKDNVKDLDNEA